MSELFLRLQLNYTCDLLLPSDCTERLHENSTTWNKKKTKVEIVSPKWRWQADFVGDKSRRTQHRHRIWYSNLYSQQALCSIAISNKVQRNYLIWRDDDFTRWAVSTETHIETLFDFHVDVDRVVFFWGGWAETRCHSPIQATTTKSPFSMSANVAIHTQFDIACNFRIHHPCRHGSYPTNTFKRKIGDPVQLHRRNQMKNDAQPKWWLRLN